MPLQPPLYSRILTHNPDQTFHSSIAMRHLSIAANTLAIYSWKFGERLAKLFKKFDIFSLHICFPKLEVNKFFLKLLPTVIYFTLDVTVCTRLQFPGASRDNEKKSENETERVGGSAKKKTLVRFCEQRVAQGVSIYNKREPFSRRVPPLSPRSIMSARQPAMWDTMSRSVAENGTKERERGREREFICQLQSQMAAREKEREWVRERGDKSPPGEETVEAKKNVIMDKRVYHWEWGKNLNFTSLVRVQYVALCISTLYNIDEPVCVCSPV